MEPVEQDKNKIYAGGFLYEEQFADEEADVPEGIDTLQSGENQLVANDEKLLEPVVEKEEKREVKVQVSMNKQKNIAFSDSLPADRVMPINSIPTEVIEYYKQFGYDEEAIRILLSRQPSEIASHKPYINSPNRSPYCG
jgi:hypothetical protein